MELLMAVKNSACFKRDLYYDSSVAGLSGQVNYHKALCSQIAVVPLSPEFIVKYSMSFGCSFFAFLIMFDLPVAHLQQVYRSPVWARKTMLQIFMVLGMFIYFGNIQSIYKCTVFILNVYL
jgi:hypothetical protein